MAEFVEVIKNKDRICEARAICDFCPLGEEARKHNMNCSEFIKKHTEEAEEIVMKWAKEHPIQTNIDKFKEVFGFIPNMVSCVFTNNCGECYVNKICDGGTKVWWEQEYKAPEEVENERNNRI